MPYDIVKQNLTRLGTLTGGKSGAIDVIRELKQGGLSIWLSDDALNYTRHSLHEYKYAEQVTDERIILSWLDLPPRQIGIRSHFYLHSAAGLLMSAMNDWPMGFRALMIRRAEQSLKLYDNTDD
ncbi:hypothetical protein D3C85_377840 [compost metagenome]